MVLVHLAVFGASAVIREVSSDGPLEEALATLTSHLTIVLARTFVPTHHTVRQELRGAGGGGGVGRGG